MPFRFENWIFDGFFFNGIHQIGSLTLQPIVYGNVHFSTFYEEKSEIISFCHYKWVRRFSLTVFLGDLNNPSKYFWNLSTMMPVLTNTKNYQMFNYSKE